MDLDGFDEWVIVLEFVPASGRGPISYQTVTDLLDELRAWQPTGLFAPDRYALQLRVPSDRPLEALRHGLALHHQAVATVGAPPPTLARIEVLSATELDRQWDASAGRSPHERPVSGVLSNDLYWATQALLRAATPSEVTDIVVGFVLGIGGEIEVAAPDGRTDKVVVDVAVDDGDQLYATADAVSVAGLIIEQSLPALVADSRAVVARLRRGDRASDLPHPPA